MKSSRGLTMSQGNASFRFNHCEIESTVTHFITVAAADAENRLNLVTLSKELLWF